MPLLFPIKEKRAWQPIPFEEYATPIVTADLNLGYRLKNLSNIFEPIIAEQAAGKTNTATTRLNLKNALQGVGYLPSFELNGVRQALDDDWLNTVIDTNAGVIAGSRQYAQAIDPDVLTAYPAQRLIELEDRKEPYNWLTRWRKAGGRTTQGMMVALKGDGVWLRISDFGHPHPPFAFGTGTWVEDLSYEESLELKLMKRGDTIRATPCPACASV